ncbi:MAG TPA: sulfite exporter TauE/SafE family protein [Burkholderiales bacterium]|nr:sulfite exporter TauE/SafE family protein [Burkholderiales bacterium]
MNGWLELLMSAAFLAGLLGGAHCAAMCGGIVGAVCRVAPGEKTPWARALAYNSGRIASYALAGAIAGSLGEAGLALRGGSTLQHAALLVTGAMLLVLALYVWDIAPLVRRVERLGGVLWRHIQPYSRHFLPADTAPRAFGLGLLWGWLPCGMVYAVLLTAAATGSAAHGALVMGAFGAATLPNLLAVAFFASRVSRMTRTPALRFAAGLTIAAFGVFGILSALEPSWAIDGLQCITPASWSGTHRH